MFKFPLIFIFITTIFSRLVFTFCEKFYSYVSYVQFENEILELYLRTNIYIQFAKEYTKQTNIYNSPTNVNLEFEK